MSYRASFINQYMCFCNSPGLLCCSEQEMMSTENEVIVVGRLEVFLAEVMGVEL